MSLQRLERPAGCSPADGLLVLHHGRGTSAEDLLPLADVLDPSKRLHVACPQAPLRLPGAPGFHWYIVPRVGFPERETFVASVGLLAEFHDELMASSGAGPERTVLSGFSQGTVMSFAMGLDPSRPAPAGILGLSGFIPRVPGWEPDLVGRASQTRVMIAHGTHDPVIGVEFARDARDQLTSAGFAVAYEETAAGHTITATTLERARAWLGETLPRSDA